MKVVGTPKILQAGNDDGATQLPTRPTLQEKGCPHS